MTETMTPEEAARVLAQASRYEDSLQQRTEGVTAMAWGAVGPGIYLTYAYAERVGAPGWAYSLLWIPWIFAGTLLTVALWRSAALAMPHVKDPLTPMGYLWRFLVLTTLLVVVMAVWSEDHFGRPLLVIGGMYVILATFNPYKMSQRGRTVAAVSGVGFLAIGAVAMMFPETPLGFAVAVTLSGIVPLLTGFYQTMTS